MMSLNPRSRTESTDAGTESNTNTSVPPSSSTTNIITPSVGGTIQAKDGPEAWTGGSNLPSMAYRLPGYVGVRRPTVLQV